MRVYNQTDIALINDLGFAVAPGMKTLVSISMSEVSKMFGYFYINVHINTKAVYRTSIGL